MNAHISNSLQFRKTQEIAVVEDLKDLHCLLEQCNCNLSNNVSVFTKCMNVFSQNNGTEHFI